MGFVSRGTFFGLFSHSHSVVVTNFKKNDTVCQHIHSNNFKKTSIFFGVDYKCLYSSVQSFLCRPNMGLHFCGPVAEGSLGVSMSSSRIVHGTNKGIAGRHKTSWTAGFSSQFSNRLRVRTEWDTQEAESFRGLSQCDLRLILILVWKDHTLAKRLAAMAATPWDVIGYDSRRSRVVWITNDSEDVATNTQITTMRRTAGN